MKAFEKWWVKQFESDPKEIREPIAREIGKIAAKSWRAALKTLKEECYCAGMYGEKGSCELVDWIKQELEEN